MSSTLQRTLIDRLSQAHVLERAGLRLLQEGATVEAISDICTGHCVQTRGHLRLLEERLAAHDVAVPVQQDTEVQIGAVRLEISEGAARTPAELAIGLYALENLEIGVYHALCELARRSHDRETELVSRQILEQEENAAELIASALDRTAVMSAEMLAEAS